MSGRASGRSWAVVDEKICAREWEAALGFERGSEKPAGAGEFQKIASRKRAARDSPETAMSIRCAARPPRQRRQWYVVLPDKDAHGVGRETFQRFAQTISAFLAVQHQGVQRHVHEPKLTGVD